MLCSLRFTVWLGRDRAGVPVTLAPDPGLRRLPAGGTAAWGRWGVAGADVLVLPSRFARPVGGVDCAGLGPAGALAGVL